MIRKTILGLFFGAIAVFAFAPFNSWIIIFIAFNGLIVLIANMPAKKAACIAFCWGMGFFGAGVHWIYVSLLQYGDFSPIVAILIVFFFVCYLSLYPALFGYLLQKLTRPYSFIQLVVAVPALWQVTEFLRGWIFNGFSWLQLGYSQLTSFLHVYIPVFGVNFLSLFIPLLCGSSIYLLHIRQKIKRKECYSILFGIFCFGLVTWSLSLIRWTKTDLTRSASFALIQGNIKQSIKWRPEQLSKTLKNYQYLTETYLPISNIIIWPEAAVTDAEIKQQPYLLKLDRLAKHHHSSVAVGIIDTHYSKRGMRILNSLIVLGDKKPYKYLSKNRYNKRHLVPFGEYIPLSKWLKPIAQHLNIPMATMSAGRNIQPQLIMQDFKFATVICYEITLPELVWSSVKSDTDFLLTVSNDAWFGDSIAPWQHLQMAQARAMEFGRPLLLSTNDGITAAINQYGKVIEKLPQFEQAVLTINLSPAVGRTPFSSWGTSIYWLVTFSLLIIVLLNCKKTKTRLSHS